MPVPLCLCVCVCVCGAFQAMEEDEAIRRRQDAMVGRMLADKEELAKKTIAKREMLLALIRAKRAPRLEAHFTSAEEDLKALMDAKKQAKPVVASPESVASIFMPKVKLRAGALVNAEF